MRTSGRRPGKNERASRAARKSPESGMDPAAVTDLRHMGFSDQEAKVYLSLLVKSPATGYEVARIASLSSANVYSTLEALEAQKIVQLVAENPKRYAPLPPACIAERIRSNLETTANRLLTRLKHWERPARVDYIWHIEGKDELRTRIGAMIRSATMHVGVRAQDAVLKSFEGDLCHAAEKGACVVMMVYGTLNPGFGHVFAHSVQGMTPIGDVENTIILTVDYEHALVASLVESQGAETHNKAFVSVVNAVIRHDVYLSEIFRHLGPAVDKTFGPALLNLRRILLPASTIAELKSKLVKSGRLDGGSSRGRAPSD